MAKKKIEISVGALIIFMIVIAIVILVSKNNQYSERVEETETRESQLEEKQEGNVVIENESTNEIINVDKTTNTSNNAKKNNDNISEENNMKNEIIGNWSPSTATNNGNEIGLQEVYGSAISYGGYLTFNEDGTYTIYDYKTGNNKNSDIGIDKNHEDYYNQMAWYKYIYEQKTGNKVSLTKFIYPEDFETKNVGITYTDEEIAERIEKFKKAIQDIKNCNFEPSYNDNACKFCPYCDFCIMEII